jgi:hypothetical protein
MAIIKTSKNMIIKTENKETVIVGKKIEDITETKWIEATSGKLILTSLKKIISNGSSK